jgi:hypothetical protein
VIRLAVWDARDQSFVTATNVSELLPAHGGSDPGEFNIPFDRGLLAVDALDRVLVAFEAGADPLQQVAARVLAFSPSTKKFSYLTHSFFPFVNFGPIAPDSFRTFRPSVAMTTRQICVAAKGSINSQNKPELGPDTLLQTTFYTVISHPAPADDPTTPVGGQVQPRLSVTSVSGGNVTISWVGGTAPFTVQKKVNLSDATWQDVTTTGNNSYTVGATGSTGFFRVLGQ